MKWLWPVLCAVAILHCVICAPLPERAEQDALLIGASCSTPLAAGSRCTTTLQKRGFNSRIRKAWQSFTPTTKAPATMNVHRMTTKTSSPQTHSSSFSTPSPQAHSSSSSTPVSHQFSFDAPPPSVTTASSSTGHHRFDSGSSAAHENHFTASSSFPHEGDHSQLGMSEGDSHLFPHSSHADGESSHSMRNDNIDFNPYSQSWSSVSSTEAGPGLTHGSQQKHDHTEIHSESDDLSQHDTPPPSNHDPASHEASKSDLNKKGKSFSEQFKDRFRWRKSGNSEAPRQAAPGRTSNSKSERSKKSQGDHFRWRKAKSSPQKTGARAYRERVRNKVNRDFSDRIPLRFKSIPVRTAQKSSPQVPQPRHKRQGLLDRFRSWAKGKLQRWSRKPPSLRTHRDASPQNGASSRSDAPSSPEHSPHDDGSTHSPPPSSFDPPLHHAASLSSKKKSLLERLHFRGKKKQKSLEELFNESSRWKGPSAIPAKKSMGDKVRGMFGYKSKGRRKPSHAHETSASSPTQSSTPQSSDVTNTMHWSRPFAEPPASPDPYLQRSTSLPKKLEGLTWATKDRQTRIYKPVKNHDRTQRLEKDNEYFRRPQRTESAGNLGNKEAATSYAKPDHQNREDSGRSKSKEELKHPPHEHIVQHEKEAAADMRTKKDPEGLKHTSHANRGTSGKNREPVKAQPSLEESKTDRVQLGPKDRVHTDLDGRRVGEWSNKRRKRPREDLHDAHHTDTSPPASSSSQHFGDQQQHLGKQEHDGVGSSSSLFPPDPRQSHPQKTNHASTSSSNQHSESSTEPTIDQPSPKSDASRPGKTVQWNMEDTKYHYYPPPESPIHAVDGADKQRTTWQKMKKGAGKAIKGLKSTLPWKNGKHATTQTKTTKPSPEEIEAQIQLEREEAAQRAMRKQHFEREMAAPRKLDKIRSADGRLEHPVTEPHDGSSQESPTLTRSKSDRDLLFAPDPSLAPRPSISQQGDLTNAFEAYRKDLGKIKSRKATKEEFIKASEEIERNNKNLRQHRILKALKAEKNPFAGFKTSRYTPMAPTWSPLNRS